MNPRDKAIDVLSKFNNNKEHALLSIEMILLEIDKKFQGFLDWDFINYWFEVKKEIEIL